MDELELWRLNWNLSRLAETDALTGLANRRRFDDVLDVAMRRAHRTGEPYSLLFLDIDHFKKLNDVLGHQAGDDALRRIGPLLSAIARRPDDLAARYGGEEFALILAGIEAAAAADLADTVLKSIVAAGITNPEGIEGVVTASVGIASTRAARCEPATLLAQADAALYRAKAAGRNQAAVYFQN
nr:GGDEF domain-containing protein [Microvirga antarctica]